MSTSPISSGKFIVITTVLSPTSDHRSLYKWDKQIGEGAFGRVYGAVRKSDGLKVAIKEVEKSKMNVSCDDVPLEVRLNTTISRVGTNFNCRSSSCSRWGTSLEWSPSLTGTRPRTLSTSWWRGTKGRICSTSSPVRAASLSLSVGISSPRWDLTSVQKTRPQLQI